MSVETILYCSFCGKSQHDVAKLIAGPRAFICDECVELCRGILDEVDADKPSPVAYRETVALRDLRLRCVELARSYGGREDDLLNRARAIAGFVLGSQEKAGSTVSIDAAGNITGFSQADGQKPVQSPGEGQKP